MTLRKLLLGAAAATLLAVSPAYAFHCTELKDNEMVTLTGTIVMTQLVDTTHRHRLPLAIVSTLLCDYGPVIQLGQVHKDWLGVDAVVKGKFVSPKGGKKLNTDNRFEIDSIEVDETRKSE
jgi:hypothetical protein